MGPRSEADLRHKFWPHPVHPAAWRVTGDKRIGFGFQLCELLALAAQDFFVEARANLPRVHYLPALVVAHQQRSKTDTMSLRVRVSTNYEFLFFRAFKLQPI